MKAASLFSGGLDSLLSVKIIQFQGIEVIPITFVSHFFGAENARKCAKANGLNLVIKDLSHKHFEVVLNPKFGYGRGMNPCMDCHALMIKEAFNFSREIGGEFIITGEVLSQRPKSQTMEGLVGVDKLTALGDITLRPLSSKLLPPTRPEREGIIDREKLYGISGRSRKKQIELSVEFGVSEFTSPAGGCILTDEVFSKRLSLAVRFCEFSESLVDLIGIGRHFRLNHSLFIVSRNEDEERKLRDNGGALFELVGCVGPIGLLFECGKEFRGQQVVPIENDPLLAARILARYAGNDFKGVRRPSGETIVVEPLDKFTTEKLLII
ncbi:MAG: hypothetical protein U9N06_04765 [candidate division WOR-3 bacterium]|nr:hypothetical protein [candidate division WOR-3 bacterium]